MPIPLVIGVINESLQVCAYSYSQFDVDWERFIVVLLLLFYMNQIWGIHCAFVVVLHEYNFV